MYNTKLILTYSVHLLSALLREVSVSIMLFHFFSVNTDLHICIVSDILRTLFGEARNSGPSEPQDPSACSSSYLLFYKDAMLRHAVDCFRHVLRIRSVMRHGSDSRYVLLSVLTADGIQGASACAVSATIKLY